MVCMDLLTWFLYGLYGFGMDTDGKLLRTIGRDVSWRAVHSCSNAQAETKPLIRAQKHSWSNPCPTSPSYTGSFLTFSTHHIPTTTSHLFYYTFIYFYKQLRILDSTQVTNYPKILYLSVRQSLNSQTNCCYAFFFILAQNRGKIEEKSFNNSKIQYWASTELLNWNPTLLPKEVAYTKKNVNACLNEFSVTVVRAFKILNVRKSCKGRLESFRAIKSIASSLPRLPYPHMLDFRVKTNNPHQSLNVNNEVKQPVSAPSCTDDYVRALTLLRSPSGKRDIIGHSAHWAFPGRFGSGISILHLIM